MVLGLGCFWVFGNLVFEINFVCLDVSVDVLGLSDRWVGLV